MNSRLEIASCVQSRGRISTFIMRNTQYRRLNINPRSANENNNKETAFVLSKINALRFEENLNHA